MNEYQASCMVGLPEDRPGVREYVLNMVFALDCVADLVSDSKI